MECQGLKAKNSWLNNVKETLIQSGISLSSVHQMDSFKTVKSVKSYLQSEFIKGWKLELDDDKRNKCHGNKLRTYRIFKTTFIKESYLKECPNKMHRQAFSKLRMGAHRLQIEVERYNNKNRIPPEQRLCKACNLGVCEDELHFVMVCPKYVGLRQSLFANVAAKFPYFESISDNTKFIWLMANVDEDVIKWLCSYIYCCFKMRNT